MMHSCILQKHYYVKLGTLTRTIQYTVSKFSCGIFVKWDTRAVLYYICMNETGQIRCRDQEMPAA